MVYCQTAAFVRMVDSTGLPKSIFVSDNAEVHDVPMSVIKRPIPSVLDEAKVQDFADKIKVRAPCLCIVMLADTFLDGMAGHYPCSLMSAECTEARLIT